MGTRSGRKGLWKRAEERLAAVFGALRQPLSGSGGRKDETASDSKHPRLYLEAKHKNRHALWGLYRTTRSKALRERKTPIIGLAEKSAPGLLLVFNSDDLPVVVNEYCRANGLKLVRRRV